MQDQILNVLVPGLVGAVVAYVGALAKDHLSARSEIDKQLMSKRAESYSSVWKSTELLSDYRLTEGVTVEQLTSMSQELHCWYFHSGGYYLSNVSQKTFCTLQKVLIGIIRNNENIDKARLRELGRQFRGALTDDLLSRRLSRKV